MANDTSASERPEKRAQWRADIGVEVELRGRTARWCRLPLTNLSEKGFRVAVADHSRVGDRVLLRFPGLAQLVGIVRWIDRGQMGCSFEQPLSPYVFEHIVRTLEAAQNRF